MKQSKKFLGMALGLFFLLWSGQSVIGQMKSVRIGSQVWSAENLGVTNFRNGDPIREAKRDEDWAKFGREGKPAWCYYENNTGNGPKYSKLYNWHAVNDKRGLAPKGWHIPNDEEWRELRESAGGDRMAGANLKDSVGWDENGNGSNEHGFAGKPGGSRYSDGTFKLIGSNGYFWSSKEFTTKSAWAFYLSRSNGRLGEYKAEMRHGFSVRCVKD